MMTKSILVALLFMGSAAYAELPPDSGINNSDAAAEEIDKSMAALSSIEQIILRKFNRTSLQTRVVKIRVKRGKKKIKVYLTWHPRKAKDVAKDTFIIVQVITKVIPQFHSIFLKAIHPKYMRWSGHVFWDATITRKAIFTNRSIEHRPQPLYRLPNASPH
jgi:ribosome-binding factor A